MLGRALESPRTPLMVSLLKDILMLMFNHLLLTLSKLLAIFFKHDLDDHDHGASTNHDDEDSPSDHDDHHEEYRPNTISASVVPIPAYFFAESVKKQLPVMPYQIFLEKNRGEVDDIDGKGCVCIICLNRIEPSHEVKVPFNCCHVFHRECLDAWVDQGQGTCPLCRSKLLPFQIKHHDNHDHDHSDDRAGDPWRRERMVSLLGDDFLFGGR